MLIFRALIDINAFKPDGNKFIILSDDRLWVFFFIVEYIYIYIYREREREREREWSLREAAERKQERVWWE